MNSTLQNLYDLSYCFFTVEFEQNSAVCFDIFHLNRSFYLTLKDTFQHEKTRQTVGFLIAEQRKFMMITVLE